MEIRVKGKYDLTTKARLAPLAICDLKKLIKARMLLIMPEGEKPSIQQLKVTFVPF